MNKKFTSILITGLFAAGVGLAVQQPTAHAAYKWTKTKNYNNVPLRAKTKGTAYMWNWNHTKKLHNLKNYPHTTWYLSKSVKMVKGHKSGIYYQVTSGNGKVSGFVHRNYLKISTNNTTKGSSNSENSGTVGNSISAQNDLSSLPILTNYGSSNDYLHFVQSASKQAVSRMILKALPNAKLDLNLSKYAQNKGSLYWDDNAVNSIKYDVNAINSSVKELKNVEQLVNSLPSSNSLPTTSDLYNALTADGISANDRESFNGKIGFVILNHLKGREGGLYSGSSIFIMK
ncbi:hypothetical protein PL11_007515 [Lentilactobacillus curieae]|uniref:D-alanyl-D-alanine carboxypeptidase n=1 Tax=Lentilactobacillus curieae TaxID=1138822 RepID=A0A1S6QJI8_9LACO|nr:hypothetical protein [Lentilactobacillus curieae]AQW21770.1 hypothetical protein PL11_007515 [Lentilactobacillus curieae]